MYILKNVSIWNHVSFVNSVYYQIMTIWTCPDVSNFNFGVSKYCRKNFNQSNEIWLKNSKPCSMLNIYRYVGSIGMGWNAPGGKRAPTSPPPPPPPPAIIFYVFILQPWNCSAFNWGQFLGGHSASQIQVISPNSRPALEKMNFSSQVFIKCSFA